MRRILVVGGGYAGFHTAWGLEKKLCAEEAEIVVVDPRPYMTYQPFLPEVAAGSIEARHAAISLRSHLRRARLAIPTWERTIRVLLVWVSALVFGRDIVSLLSVQHPRRAFVSAGAAFGGAGAVAKDGV